MSESTCSWKQMHHNPWLVRWASDLDHVECFRFSVKVWMDCWNIHASSVDWEKQNLVIVCQDLQEPTVHCVSILFSWNLSWRCRGRKFDITIMVQEQWTVFTFFSSKDRTFACALGSDILAGLTIAREQLWTG